MPILLYDMSLIKGEAHRQPLVIAELGEFSIKAQWNVCKVYHSTGESYSQALEVMRQSNGDMKQQMTLAKVSSFLVFNDKYSN